MGETENNKLKLFYKNEEELIILENFTIDEIKDFFLNQTEYKFKEVKRTELDLDFSQFRSYFEKQLLDLKNTIFLTQNSENQKTNIICKSLSILRDRIDGEYRHKFSDLINWHKPDPLNKILYNNIKNGFNPPNWAIDNPKKQLVKKTPLWYLIFNDILNGNIVVTENEKIFNYKETTFKNPTQLGNHLAKIYGKNESTIRLYFTESLWKVNSGDKNIFLDSKKLEIESLLKNKENKMCPYFKNKLEILFST